MTGSGQIQVVRGLPHYWVEEDREVWVCLFCGRADPPGCLRGGWMTAPKMPPKPEPGTCDKRPPLEVRRR